VKACISKPRRKQSIVSREGRDEGEGICLRFLRFLRATRKFFGSSRKMNFGCIILAPDKQFPRQWSLPSRMGKPPDRFSADDSYE